MPPKISIKLQELVRLRAHYLCEYCHTDERWQLVQFTIDHIVPIAAGGKDESGNLALACFHCNRRKSDKQFVPDQSTGIETPLFNPRTMDWNDHFYWSNDGVIILALTDIGRITVKYLQLNRERILQIRVADVFVDRHPPKSDRRSKSKQPDIAG